MHYPVGGKAVLRTVYGETLAELGAENGDIIVLDADVSKSTQTSIFAEKFPDRFFNLGIAEQDMLGTAAGLANYGKIPFASTFAIFETGRAWEQIRNSICYTRLPVKIVATHAGLTVGPDGGSHQSVEDIAIMRALPNMSVIVPADAVETRSVLRRILHYSSGPVYVRLGRDKAVTVFPEDYQFEFGQATLLRPGSDVTLIACGILTGTAVQAAALLEERGISAAVVNMSSIKPLDEAMIVKMARETGALVTCEEHSVIGGLYSAVAEVTARRQPVPVEAVAINDQFGESGEGDELLEKHGLTAAGILARTEAVLARKKAP